MSSIINGFILLSLIITVTYFIGLFTFLNDYNENSCEMTYMFEYPQYVKISQKIDEKYQMYGLYAYSEGRLTERSRNMDFDGIPVLFIPGNSGSYKQGRSLASVALRKALNSRTPFHFDYFLIDLHHEFSGLNGAVLLDQLEYVNKSLYTVLDLYKEKRNPPNYVILIGHSIGGVIARRILSDSLRASQLVPIVITLATPHKRPPLILDSYIYDFYRKINTSGALNTTFVSITGGYEDFLVPSFLTTIPDSSTLNIACTHMPRVWVAADHLSIMWCKQLILTLNRAIFDSVDPKTKHISTNPNFRELIFNHHLVSHNGLNPFLRNNYINSVANIRNTGDWIEHLNRQYTVKIPKHSNPKFYMVRLLDHAQHESVSIVALNLKTIEWAFVCGAHIPRDKSRVCEEFTHLSHLSELSPSQRYKRRSLRINMHDLIRNNSDWTHVVIRVLPSDEDVILYVDVHNSNERKLTVTLPHILSFKRHILIDKTPENIIDYRLELPNLHHIMQYYQLFVENLECNNQMQHATASLIAPWANQNRHKFFLENDSKPLDVRLYVSRPIYASNQSAIIQLTLDPSCRYKISIRGYFPGVLAQLARFYSPLLVVNIAAVVLMTLNSQLKSIATNHYCSLFFVAIKEGAKPYYILTSVKLISRFLSIKPFVNYIPAPDWLIMSQEGTDFFILPLLSYICSVGIVWFLGICLGVSLVVCETTVHKFTLKFLARSISFTVSWSDYVISALHKLPCIVAATLVFLTLTTTGSLALCVGTVFYFLRLTQLSQDYIEELVWYYVKKFGAKFRKNKSKDKKPEDNNNDIEMSANDAMFFHTTLFFLWCIITIINIPSVLTWAHNFNYSTKLQRDPSFIPGLVLSICALPLWQFDLPKIERHGYTELGQFVSVLAVVSLIYAPVSIFRLNYTLTTAIAVVTLHQLVAPNRDLVVGNSRSEQPISYETVKAKLE